MLTHFDDIYHGTAVVSVLAAADNESSAKGQGLDRSFSGVLSSVVRLPYQVFVYDSSMTPRNFIFRQIWRAAIREIFARGFDDVQDFNNYGSYADLVYHLNTISVTNRKFV